MRETPAGDFDYDKSKVDYATIRKTDPRIGALVRRSFGEAHSLLNVGAGAGSYEPLDIEVVAVEPSEQMRLQRPAHLTTAIDATAEALPFDDKSFDASLASITVHQWSDLEAGLQEMRRVTRGPIVILTFEPEQLKNYWLAGYVPEIMEIESRRMPSFERLKAALGGSFSASQVPIPLDCQDGFAEAYYGRPEAFLDEPVRRAQSFWGFMDRDDEERCVARLRDDLSSGAWDRTHGDLRHQPHFAGSLYLITAHS